jgi:hypothetical protein
MGQPQQKEVYTEEEMRSEIIATVARLDKSFLRVVHSMLSTYAEEQLEKDDLTVICEPDGTPVDVEKFEEEMQAAIDEPDEGNGTSVTDYKKKTEAWLGITR